MKELSKEELEERCNIIEQDVKNVFAIKAKEFLNPQNYTANTDNLEKLKEEYLPLKKKLDVIHACERVVKGEFSVDSLIYLVKE